MAVVAWGPGRVAYLKVANGQTESDILDLGAFAAVKATGIVAADATVTEVPTLSLIPCLIANQFAGKLIVFHPDTTTVALRNQQRLISASSVAGVLTVAALSTAPAAGDVFDIWEISASKSYRRWDITILGPATVTGTVNPQVSNISTGNFVILQSGGANITLPTASKATAIIPLVARFLKLVGTSQGQDSTWIVMGSTIDIGR